MYQRSTALMTAAILIVGFGFYRSSTPASSGNRAPSKPRAIQDKPAAHQSDETLRLAKEVADARKKAFEDGRYACCIRPPCSWCLLNLGKCSCVLGVGSGRYACRECHGGWEAGQGRLPGTTKDDVRKMKTLSVGTAEAAETTESAGATAPEAKTPDADAQLVQSGHQLFVSNKCRTCHKMEGEGGATGPDITHEARRHADIQWHVEHLKDPTKMSPGSTMPSFAQLKPEALKALAAYLASRK